MPPRSWQLRIDDILQAIANVETYLAGFDFDDFQRDQRTIDAVIRNLEVIGEAAKHVDDQARATMPNVAWKQIAAFRNILAHEYFGIDLSIIWRTAKQDLAVLRQQLQPSAQPADETTDNRAS